MNLKGSEKNNPNFLILPKDVLDKQYFHNDTVALAMKTLL
jgi:hypothetical protein